MITENLSTLKIHKLTQEQYDRAVENGNIEENALYLTPDKTINHLDETINIHNTSTSAHNDIRNLISDLSATVNSFLDVDDTTRDQLSEVLVLIDANKGTLESLTTSKINVSDIVNNLTTNSTSKVLSAAQGVIIKGLIDALQNELDTHTHTISEVTGLQTALNGKAASSHGTHVSYSTTAPVMDGTASAGSASTVARSDHKHPTDTSRASQTSLDNHTNNTTVHITATERTNWNTAYTHSQSSHAPSNAEKNQNAFSNVAVGTTTIAADSATDTLTFVAGSNVTITPDATNDKITITSAYPNAAGSALGLVKSGGDVTISSGVITVNDDSHNHTIANIDDLQSSLDGKQATITGGATTITGSNLTESRALVSNSSGKVAVSAVTDTELGYLSGVESSVQTQLNNRRDLSSLGTKINSNTDIDTLTTPALYYSASASVSNTLTNTPISDAGYQLLVCRHYQSNRLYQYAVGNNNRFFTRQYANSKWTDWERIYTTANPPALSELGVTATATELNYVDGVTSSVQAQLDGKADSGHTHDDRYYTETEIDTMLSGKANSSHGNHVPTTQTASNKVFLRNDNTWQAVTPANIGAAASSHTHTVANISDLTATATELNYMDGVTSNVQNQLDNKSDKSHTHSYVDSAGTATLIAPSAVRNFNGGSSFNGYDQAVLESGYTFNDGETYIVTLKSYNSIDSSRSYTYVLTINGTDCCSAFVPLRAYRDGYAQYADAFSWIEYYNVDGRKTLYLRAIRSSDNTAITIDDYFTVKGNIRRII